MPKQLPANTELSTDSPTGWGTRSELIAFESPEVEKKLTCLIGFERGFMNGF
jgi:hypothetical protein